MVDRRITKLLIVQILGRGSAGYQSHPRGTPAACPAVCPEFPGCTVSRGHPRIMVVEMVLADCPGQSTLRRKGPTEDPPEAAAPSHTGSYSDVPN